MSEIRASKSAVLAGSLECRHPSDEFDPSVSDLTVLVVDEVQVLVVTDDANNSVKSLYTQNRDPCTSKLALDDGPWGITRLKDDQVIVAVPDVYKLMLVRVSPELAVLSAVSTSKRYHSVAVLQTSTMAAGCDHPSCVDILNWDGHVMKSVSMLNNERLFSSPRYLCVNSKGNLLVSDRGQRSVTCLTSDGELVWRYQSTGDRTLRYPVGIQCTKKGILVVDRDSKKVIQLNRSGEYVQDVLIVDDNGSNPWCMHRNKDKSLYVCCVSQIKYFKFKATYVLDPHVEG